MRYSPYLILAAGAAALAIGFFLFGHSLSLLLEDMVFGIWDWLIRTLRPRARRLQEIAKEARSPKAAQTRYGKNFLSITLLAVLRYPLPILVATVLAVWVWDWMLSPIIIVVGAVVSSALFARMSRRFYNQLTDELEMLILQFVSRYPLRNSVATALSEAADQLPKGLLKDAAAGTATRLKLQDVGNPFRDLVAVPHPVARRFAGVLMRAGFASPEVFLDLLSQLRKDTESRRELQQRVRRDLTLESATITILQVVLILSLVAVVLIPSWRVYYTGTIGNRVVYMLLVGMGIIGTVIGENEVRYLEEA
ncbi:MAG: hypothetical protein JW929_14205 [Anaerolineales bacterium]|nr:hypothetical protein [Anaerolineales bacterium]